MTNDTDTETDTDTDSAIEAPPETNDVDEETLDRDDVAPPASGPTDETERQRRDAAKDDARRYLENSVPEDVDVSAKVRAEQAYARAAETHKEIEQNLAKARAMHEQSNLVLRLLSGVIDRRSYIDRAADDLANDLDAAERTTSEREKAARKSRSPPSGGRRAATDGSGDSRSDDSENEGEDDGGEADE